MGIRLKFVKGAYLSTYMNNMTSQVSQHIIQVDQLLRIKSKTKPPASPQPGIDLKPSDLVNVRRVHVSAPFSGGSFPQCFNDNTTMSSLVRDQTLTASANLINIEVVGGNFSYPHSSVVCPNHPAVSKAFGWIQVDFPTGPVTIDLYNAQGTNIGSHSVSDGQSFDICGFIMYVNEPGAIEEESDGFVVVEQGDGSGSPPPS